ncbi:MAG TPA: sulfatase-like hydrolase/transferase, partial [Bryobacterales bacterium]|nr:sulfatase-like hydrolase/transferase [Bryobacterales bacterium]
MPQKLNRRRFLSTSVTGAAGAAALSGAEASAASPPRPPARQPNVIVFYTDQQRWDTIGAYGCPMGLTPNLDQMAATGVRFEHAFTVQPVCAPARSSIQTGKYPTTTGVIHNGLVLKDDETTLAHHFKRAGYQTGYIGKWHLGGTRGAVPLERRGGYDEWWMASDVLEFTSTPYEGTVFNADNQPIRFEDKYRVDFLTDLAINFIQRKKSQPFFLFLSYLEPHFQNSTNTFIAPKGYADRYRNNFYIPPDLAPYPGDWRSQLPEYYGIIARFDECFGRLMDELKSQGVAGNTIVAYATDHGCHFRTRNTEYKRSCHDASTRIPMMIRGPGFEGGRVVSELVSVVDLPPTLLDAVGIDVPSAMQGRSLRGLVGGNRDGWRNEVFIQMREVQLGRALRTPQWKYCIYDPDNR